MQKLKCKFRIHPIWEKDKALRKNLQDFCLMVSLLTLSVMPYLSAQPKSYDQLMQYYYQQKNFNGVVLLASNGKIDYLASVGVADRDQQTPITTNSHFRIASMTKTFTAVLVMKLYEEGKIQLDKTIGEYLPNYQGEGRDKVSIHHLLCYASGINNDLATLGMKPYQVRRDLEEFINTYCVGRLIYAPGSKSEYGNTEYIILQKIIEQITSKSYESYLKQVILKPLDLKNTGVLHYTLLPKRLTKTYSYQDSLKMFSPDEEYYAENYFGAGNMYSCAQDMFKFSEALFNYKILNTLTTTKMLEIHPSLGYTAYSLWGANGGWGAFEEAFYYRTGGILGASANWIHTRQSKKTIIVLSNTNANNLYELSEQFYLLSLGKPLTLR